MRVLYIFDSFKNSLHTDELGSLAVKISSETDSINYYSYLPVSDGGEGSLKIVERFTGGEKINIHSMTADGSTLETYYIIKDGTAYIEVAMTSGIEKLKNRKKSILKRNTYGTGVVIKDAIDKGIKNIVLFVGGTATCDGGIGIIKALNGEQRDEFLLKKLKIPEFSHYTNIKITIATDVNNPLLGSKGASYVFSAQKGASKKETELLELKMQELRDLVFLNFGQDIDFPGAGAGGGIPALLSAYFNVNMVSGFDYISSLINLESKFMESDLIVTGEGKFDKQSYMGKVVGKVLQKAKQMNKEAMVICGISLIDVAEIPVFQLSAYKRSVFDKEESVRAFSNLIKSLVLYSKLYTKKQA